MPWQLEPGHSYIGWGCSYLGIHLIKGIFRKLDGTLELPTDHPSGWAVELRIDAASIDSNNERRDNTLRGPDYLDAERFPTITFKSKRVEPDGDAHRIVGDLTLHGITREVAVGARFNGDLVDGRGIPRRGFSGGTTIDRRDFDIHVGPVDPIMDVAGDQVHIEFEVQVINRD